MRILSLKGWCTMSNQNAKNAYDDGNIPEVDLPKNNVKNTKSEDNAEPLPESFRPRKDGPGGD